MTQHLVGTGKLYVLCSHLIVTVIAGRLLGRLLGRLTCRRSLPATQKLPWEPHQDAVYCSPVALILAMLGYELASRDSQCDFALFLSTAGLI